MKKILFLCLLLTGVFSYSSCLHEKAEIALSTFSKLAEMYKESIDDYQAELSSFKGRPKHYEIEVKQNKHSARQRMIRVADCLCFSERLLLLELLSIFIEKEKANSIAARNLDYADRDLYAILDSVYTLPQFKKISDRHTEIVGLVNSKETQHGLDRNTIGHFVREPLK